MNLLFTPFSSVAGILHQQILQRLGVVAIFYVSSANN
jgi:hypothetical protein